MHRHRTAALVLSLSLGLTACGGDDAPSVEAGTAPTPVGNQGSGQKLTLDGAGKQLSVDQTEKALIDTESTPEGQSWVVEPIKRSDDASASTSSTQDPVDIPECEQWFQTWKDLANADGVAWSQEQFSLGGKIDQGSLQYAVRSFKSPEQATARQQALERMPRVCSKFTQTITTSKGEKLPVQWTTEAMAFQRPGDASQSTKMTASWTNPGEPQATTRYMQMTIVQFGHNEIFVTSYGPEQIPGSVMTKMLMDGQRKLEQASKG